MLLTFGTLVGALVTVQTAATLPEEQARRAFLVSILLALLACLPLPFWLLSRLALQRDNAMAKQSRHVVLVAQPGHASRAPEQPNPLLQDRIKQLEECTIICTREEWENEHRVRLDGAACSECCICMSNIERDAQVRALACGHIFHLLCVAEWFMQDKTFELRCPMCRKALSQQSRLKDTNPQQCDEPGGRSSAG